MPVSDWRPVAGVERMRLRAEVLQQLRDFMQQRSVLEVDTPTLSVAGVTDPCIESMILNSQGNKETPRFLHTSPEYPMKRLLAAGSGSIYQVCKVFRAGEQGRLHNPEFTLLEWYRVGYDHLRLMDEVAELVRLLFADIRVLPSFERMTYQDLFLKYAAVDGMQASVDELRACAQSHQISIPVSMGDDWDEWRDLILTQLIEPQLHERAIFVYHYPASQASLARLHEEGYAERFELYLYGVELANGFHELSNADEQRRRFVMEQQQRIANGLPERPMDERLLAAIAEGLPDCAGVALGIDRLLMLLAGAECLDDVLCFPFGRA
ncbi:MAG: EF-P lysine aminoacylase GenX [Gammaproteobacteria bacterium]|nr:EF-P lysine aminoacylase GenX [Gammaproteobacteria bacterium]